MPHLAALSLLTHLLKLLQHPKNPSAKKSLQNPVRYQDYYCPLEKVGSSIHGYSKDVTHTHTENLHNRSGHGGDGKTLAWLVKQLKKMWNTFKSYRYFLDLLVLQGIVGHFGCCNTTTLQHGAFGAKRKNKRSSNGPHTEPVRVYTVPPLSCFIRLPRRTSTFVSSLQWTYRLSTWNTNRNICYPSAASPTVMTSLAQSYRTKPIQVFCSQNKCQTNIKFTYYIWKKWGWFICGPLGPPCISNFSKSIDKHDDISHNVWKTETRGSK